MGRAVWKPGTYSIGAHFVGEGVSQGAAAELMLYGMARSLRIRYDLKSPNQSMHCTPTKRRVRPAADR